MDVASATSPLRRGSLRDIIDNEARRRTRRKFYGWGSVVIALVLAGVGYWLMRPKPLPFEARFRMEQVTRGDVVREVQATGRIEALVTVSVGSEISGRIASVEVDFNQHVTQGQVLARFDRAALEAQLAQARAGAAQAQMALALARTDQAQAARTFDRVTRLSQQNAVSNADYDAAEAANKLAGQRVEAAEAQLAAQRATLVLAQTNLDHSVIRSPIEGVVITRNIDPGQTVAAMLQSPTLFSVAADLRKVRVITQVDEADIGEVADDQAATFTVNAYPERVFEGKVVEVRNSPVVVQDVVTYGTVVEADNLDLALKPGMTATVRIRTAAVRDMLRVPSAALRFTPPERAAAPSRHAEHSVYAVDGQQLRSIAVVPGISDGELTAVQSAALHANARVVVDLTAAGRTAYGIAH